MSELLELEIDSSTELISISTTTESAFERGLVDINFFASLAIPDIMVSPLPYFYITAFNIIVDRSPESTGKILRFALGLPRGHAKTTFIKILIAWLIVYDRANFILIICAVEDNAVNIVADVSRILGSPNIEAIYGKWNMYLSIDNKGTKEALYRGRVITLIAKGIMTAVRGLNSNNRRPDVIVCDDAQTRENDQSAAESNSLMEWLTLTLFKVIETRGDRLIVYIGNMYSDKCILQKLKLSKSWITLIVGAILQTGKPLWATIHSLESLKESYIHDADLGLGAQWFAEMMNDPRTVGTSLIADLSLLKVEKLHEVIYDGVFITIDPAGDRATSDDSVIVVHGILNSIGSVIEIDAGIYSPMETVNRALALAELHGASVIGIETVGYQVTLMYWFNEAIKHNSISNINIVEITPKNRSKTHRIQVFVVEAEEGNYTFASNRVKSIYAYQALAYKIGRKDNKDDILDCVAYGIDMRVDYWHLITNNLVTIGNGLKDTTRRVADYSNNTPF